MMLGKIVIVVLSRIGQRQANEFCKKFYGQDTTTGGKRYRRIGLLDRIPHIKLARGVIVISRKDTDEVIEFLRKSGVDFYVRDVVLTPEDQMVLRRAKGR
jgi:hypothetical protein